MIILHFYLQAQFINELFHIYFTSWYKTVVDVYLALKPLFQGSHLALQRSSCKLPLCIILHIILSIIQQYFFSGLNKLLQLVSTFITFAVILTFRVVIAFSFDTKIIAKTNKQKKRNISLVLCSYHSLTSSTSDL